jgi:hypothetical protein
MKLTSPAIQSFQKGVAAATEAERLVGKAKERILDAGFFFIKSHAACDHGEFLALIEHHAKQVSQRSVYTYMEFARLACEWAKEAKPTLTGAKLEKAAYEIVLRSPKPFTLLLREWKMIEQVGAYHPTDYQARKLTQGELNFSFEAAVAQLDALTVKPEVIRELKPSSLQKLHERLKASLALVDECMNGGAIEA